MGKNLHVVDISPCVYAGSFNTRSFIQGGVVNTSSGYRERNIPTGGASMLFNILGQYMGTGDIVFVADRQPTVKYELDPQYKQTRTHPHNVMIGKSVAECILKDCGFVVQYKDGYEADDIIYSIVHARRHAYEHVYVHTGDSDLYCLVSDTTSILPTSSKAKSVNMANYNYACRANGDTPYNTVVFQKFLRGDASKGILSLPKELQRQVCALFCTSQFLPFLGDTVFVLSLMRRYFPELHTRARLFYPIHVPEAWDIVQDINALRIKEWAYEIGNRKVPGRRGDMSKQVAEMLELSLYLD